MPRPAETYRGARKRRWRDQKLIWREGNHVTRGYMWHESMPQPGLNGLPHVPTIQVSEAELAEVSRTGVLRR